MRYVLLVLLSAIAVSAQESPREINCRGIITSFEKEGFSGMRSEGGHDVFDVTWILVTHPDEYRGLKQMLLSNPGAEESPFGKIGDEIDFTAYKTTLESEKTRSEKPTQPTAESRRG